MIVTFHFNETWRSSVALLFLAFFVLPAVGYGADPSSMALEGKKAYKAKDYARARALYDQARMGGDAGGCSNPGNMLYTGEGGAQDKARARALYDQACKGGDAKGCSNLGFMFDTGKGGARDDARARALYDQACKGGDARGCSKLQ